MRNLERKLDRRAWTMDKDRGILGDAHGGYLVYPGSDPHTYVAFDPETHDQIGRFPTFDAAVEAVIKSDRRADRAATLRAFTRAAPKLWRAIQAATPEILDALADDGRIDMAEALEIGVAFAAELADDTDAS